MARRLRFVLPLLLVTALLAALYSFFVQTDHLRQQRLLLGTVVEITVSGSDRARLQQALDAAFDEIDRIERLMSPHISTSDVARLSAATGPIKVAPETSEVLALGLEVAVASDGAFDMTLGALKSLWNIESDNPRVPAAAEISAALSQSGPLALTLDGRLVSKSDPSVAVDLGGIAKGYALDRAAAVLRRHQVNHASINAGGDIVLIGPKAPGTPWRIGIQDPDAPERVLAFLELEDVAVVTSGDYERFFVADSVRYHHLFDPATGYPARRSRSVTILADDAALADALSTAVFVLGPTRGITLLSRYPTAKGMIIDASGSRHLSAGMEQVLTWL